MIPQNHACARNANHKHEINMCNIRYIPDSVYTVSYMIQ